MSEDWFKRSYRSEERPPTELDARVLAGARRATRRWAVPLAASAVLMILAALLFAALLASVELDVPPADEGAGRDPTPARLDPPAPTSDNTSPKTPVSPPRSGPCSVPNVLVGPLGGPGRRDRAALCHVGGLLRVDVVWDGEAPCPSQLSVPVAADAPVALDGSALRVGSARYRCEQGQWAVEAR